MLLYCKYFAKQTLKWIPFFGWGIWLMGSIMVDRNWTLDKKKIEKTFRMLKQDEIPSWIISYPEGTRATEAKLNQVCHFILIFVHLNSQSRGSLPLAKDCQF